MRHVERVRSRLRQRAQTADGVDGGGSLLDQLGGGAQIAGEIARRLDGRRPVAVGCLDLRRFESFNLRYGYDRGDDLLEWLAGLLVDGRRCFPGTFVGRLGSDDFVVVASSDRGSGIGPRLSAERNAGQYLWDVHMGPVSNVYTVLTPANDLQPIKPFLESLPPDVKDDTKWAGRFGLFTDPNNPVTLITEFSGIVAEDE